MILVVVGSSQFPFDRLLRAVDALALDEQLVVQHGASAVRPRGAQCVPFLPLETLTGLVRSARAIVTHGGVGSILLALTNGKRPYVVPRLRAFRETVDDHQLESARRFAKAGLVTLVEDLDRLPEVLSGAGGRIDLPAGETRLVRELHEYLERRIHPTPAGAS
jgi:UDP-N-acetylglucosamine transferase subunit ALG13